MRTIPQRLRAGGLATLFACGLVASGSLAAQAPGRGGAPAPAASLEVALTRARRALAARDFVALRRTLSAARTFAPADGAVLYHLARAEALTGDAPAALRTLRRLAPQGVARDVAADSAFGALRVGPLAAQFAAVVARLAAAAAPVVRSDTAFLLADPDFIPEGIAYDPGSDAFYVGSLHAGGVLRVGRDGATTPFLPAGPELPAQILGLRVETSTGRLWLAALVPDSAAPRFADGGGGWAALHAYDLRTGRLLARYPVPDSTRPHLLNDIAVTLGGDVYVTDSEGRALYRLRRGARALERIATDRARFTYPNGIAATPDGRRVYVAHREGLSVVDLREAGGPQLRPVPTPPGVSAGGIDGLVVCGPGLVAIQGLLDFEQVTAFALAPGGRRITAARALERRHPAYDGPTTGAVAAGALYYVANAQLGRLAPDGTLAASADRRLSVVLRLPVPGGCDTPVHNGQPQ